MNRDSKYCILAEEMFITDTLYQNCTFGVGPNVVGCHESL